jgi:hypothetical protein
MCQQQSLAPVVTGFTMPQRVVGFAPETPRSQVHSPAGSRAPLPESPLAKLLNQRQTFPRLAVNVGRSLSLGAIPVSRLSLSCDELRCTQSEPVTPNGSRSSPCPLSRSAPIPIPMPQCQHSQSVGDADCAEATAVSGRFSGASEPASIVASVHCQASATPAQAENQNSATQVADTAGLVFELELLVGLSCATPQQLISPIALVPVC